MATNNQFILNSNNEGLHISGKWFETNFSFAAALTANGKSSQRIAPYSNKFVANISNDGHFTQLNLPIAGILSQQVTFQGSTYTTQENVTITAVSGNTITITRTRPDIDWTVGTDSSGVISSNLSLSATDYGRPSSYNGYYFRVPHGLSFIPLVMLEYSTDVNLSKSIAPSLQPITSLVPPVKLYAYADANYVYIADPGGMGGSGDLQRPAFTVYCRLICLIPPGENTRTVGQPSNQNFNLNTNIIDYRILKSGVATSTTSENVIYHNLGYKPIVLAWKYVPYSPNPEIQDWFGVSGLQITNSTIVLPKCYTYPNGGSEKYYYIILANGVDDVY